MIRAYLFLMCTLLATGSQSLHADLPLMKEMAGNRTLPKTYGIGTDVINLRQDYGVQSVDIGLPDLVIPDPSILSVKSTVNHADIKLDAWLFPFLNVFGIVGTLEGETEVDLSVISLPQLPVPLGTVDIDYDGSVFGVGFTTVYAKEDWFVALTGTYTDTSLDGDFTSAVASISLQPRIGREHGRGYWWIGATYLDTDEEHSGLISLGIPTLPALPFEVELNTSDRWNLNLGAQWQLSENFEASLETGAAHRNHVLANVTWRF